VLISGIPGSGKSHFGRWLAQHKGAFTVDVDTFGVRAAGLQPVWEAFKQTLDARQLIEQLSRRHALWAWVWGFPPLTRIEVVRAFVAGGAAGWWFGGDRGWARKYFCERDNTAGERFDRQCADIDAAWPAIQAIFGEHLVDTIAPDGTRLPCEEIYRRIFNG
jgi:hypothetical protein